MSLARALTTRRKTSNATKDAYLGRAASQRAPNAKPIKREEISLPVELISTTNVLSYEAPNIPNAPHVRDRGGRYFNPATVSSAISVASSHTSDNDSDNTASDHSHETDATSIDLSSPETNSNRFSNFAHKTLPKSSGTMRSVRSNASSQDSYTGVLSSMSMPSLDAAAPAIPARAPSHSKRAHTLSHTRSLLARNAPDIPPSPKPLDTSASRHDSFDMFNSAAVNKLATSATPVPVSHPFGKELEQLNEAAEEFGNAVRDAEADADLAVMQAKGLIRFCATDYMSEFSSMNPFGDELAAAPALAWI